MWNALHGVVVAFYARSRFGGGCESFDDLSDLLLELLHLLHVLVVERGNEHESYISLGEWWLSAAEKRSTYRQGGRFGLCISSSRHNDDIRTRSTDLQRHPTPGMECVYLFKTRMELKLNLQISEKLCATRAATTCTTGLAAPSTCIYNHTCTSLTLRRICSTDSTSLSATANGCTINLVTYEHLCHNPYASAKAALHSSGLPADQEAVNNY